MHRSSPHPAWLPVLVALLGALSLGSPAALARSHRRPSPSATAAPAAPVAPSHDKLAELLQQGSAALAARDFATAGRALSAAYRLAPATPQLYPLAQLALAEGRIVEAQDLFRRFLHDSSAPDDSPARQEAQRALELPAPATGEVRIVGDSNTSVLVDDRLVGVLPLPLPLLLGAGDHRVVLEREAMRLEDSVTAMAGRVVEVRCQFHLGVLAMTVVPALLLSSDLAELPTEAQRQLTQALAQATSAVHLSVLPRKPALLQSPQLADCLDTPRCRIELAVQNSVQYVLSLKAVLRAGTKTDWQLAATLLDATVQDVASEKQEECEGCSADQVAARLGSAAEAVLTQALARRRGTLVIESTPPGAEVLLAERPLGLTPLRRPRWVGPLALTFRHPGYHTQHATLAIEEDKVASLNLTLSPEPPAGAPPLRTVILPRPRWRLALGGTALGLGAGLALLGGSALGIDGQCVSGSFKGNSCQDIYMTVGIGSGLLVGAAVLLGGGATLLALPGARRKVPLAATVERGARSDGSPR